MHMYSFRASHSYIARNQGAADRKCHPFAIALPPLRSLGHDADKKKLPGYDHGTDRQQHVSNK